MSKVFYTVGGNKIFIRKSNRNGKINYIIHLLNGFNHVYTLIWIEFLRIESGLGTRLNWIVN